MAAKGQFLQRLGSARQVRRRGRLRPCADDGPGARAIRRFCGGRERHRSTRFSARIRRRARPVERPVDSSRAPSPKKLDAQPTGGSVLVLGDSMADWLAYGLEDALGDTPDLAVVRKNRASSGLIRYDSRNENQDWAQVIREAIAATKPKFIVMMVGLERSRVDPRSRVPVTTPTGTGREACRAGRHASGEAGSRRRAAASLARRQARCNGRRTGSGRGRRSSPRPSRIERRRHHDDLSRPRIPLRRMGRLLHQADRRHDRRAEERRRAGVLGRPAVDPRAEIDERHAVSQRPLPRPRREGRHQLHRRLGRLRRRERPLHRCRAPTSKARSAGCAPATACISPRPARASLRIISSAKSAAC